MIVTSWREQQFREELMRDTLEGLSAPQKAIPSKYFYDRRGSELFEQICCLPEYYQTRCELSILKKAAPAIMKDFREGVLIELGSGANWKVRVLLDAAYRQGNCCLVYVPIDVSHTALAASCRQLQAIYASLQVRGVVGNFSSPLSSVDGGRKLILFFGSTIGNLDESERTEFLKDLAGSMTPGDRLLVGVDMMKPVEILERAYNDRAGITAAFNKNVLHVINRGAEADFEIDAFSHQAFYNQDAQRVEMHLRAERDLQAYVAAADTRVEIGQNQTIRTEICAKFTAHTAEKMAHNAGLGITRRFSDANEWFSLLELVPIGG